MELKAEHVRDLNLKKFFLYLLIGSVALSAAIGIAVVLFGDFGEFEVKILLSTLTVTITSILGLACGAYLETGRGRALPVAGIALAAVSAALWIAFIWSLVGNEHFFVRLVMSTTLLACACSHLSLVSLARLDRRFLWSRYAAQFAVTTLAAILLAIIWADGGQMPEYVSRTLGVLSIAVAALTVLTPVFHRLSKQETGLAAIDAEIERLRQRLAELEKARAEKLEDAN